MTDSSSILTHSHMSYAPQTPHAPRAHHTHHTHPRTARTTRTTRTTRTQLVHVGAGVCRAEGESEGGHVAPTRLCQGASQSHGNSPIAIAWQEQAVLKRVEWGDETRSPSFPLLTHCCRVSDPPRRSCELCVPVSWLTTVRESHSAHDSTHRTTNQGPRPRREGVIRHTHNPQPLLFEHKLYGYANCYR